MDQGRKIQAGFVHPFLSSAIVHRKRQRKVGAEHIGVMYTGLFVFSDNSNTG